MGKIIAQGMKFMPGSGMFLTHFFHFYFIFVSIFKSSFLFQLGENDGDLCERVVRHGLPVHSLPARLPRLQRKNFQTNLRLNEEKLLRQGYQRRGKRAHTHGWAWGNTYTRKVLTLHPTTSRLLSSIVLDESSFWFRFRFVIHRSQ